MPATDWTEVVVADEAERFERHAAALAALQRRRPRAEGGFDRDELDYAVPKIGLSRNILRVETAAIVAGAQLVSFHQ